MEGQKFLPEVEGHFFEFVVSCCSNKKQQIQKNGPQIQAEISDPPR